MKRTASITLLLALLISGSLPSYAQKGRRAAIQPAAVDATITYERIDAVTDGQGVLIRWHTSVETQNFGFNVYRITSSGRELVNETLITGSVFKRSLPGHSGEDYELYDPAGRFDTVYVIDNTFVGGRVSSSSPFGVRSVKDLEIESGRSSEDLERMRATSAKTGIVLRNDLAVGKDLSEIIERATPEADINTHRWVVSQPGAKIAVKFEGFYRVTRAQLEAAGFNVNAPSANWRLFMEGNEQAINVGAGDQYIEFYGTGRDTRESDTRVYYLLADSNPGRRIETKVIRNVGGAVVAQSYRSTVQKRERTSGYNGMIKNGDAENFWGRPVTDTPMVTPIGVFLNRIDPAAATALIRVKLQGIQGSTHNVKVVVNGNEAGFVPAVGNTVYQATLTIPTSFLVEGNNLVDLTEENSSSASYFDQVEITFNRRFDASADRLSYYTPGYRKVDVAGFSTANVRVFDTTYPGLPQEVVGLNVVQDGGTFTAKLPSHRAMVMYAAENSSLLSPFSVTFNNPSNWSTPGHVVQYLIISHSAPDFLNAAQQWKAFRETTAGGRFSVAVVDVADIFDEFGYGSLSAEALKGFLEYAYKSWDGSPQYVLLLGDGSYDPRNYDGFGNWDLVPTKFLELIFEESGSDEALADFNHDGLAEMPIGRVPARSAFDVLTVLNKSMGFETLENQSLNRGALCAYDLPAGFDFEGMCLGLHNELPPGTPTVLISRGLPPPNQGTPDPQAHTNLMNALNTGKYIANFAGHGTSGVWGNVDFFNANDAALLTNGNRQSIFTMLTCYNGVFFRSSPLADSVSERLLFAQNGGGAITWASTTETTPDFQFTMGARFYNEIGASNIKRIGDLVKSAKSTIAGSDVGYSWVLLGDPALKVR
ncbi:MAG: hypothetical protein KBD94_00070 [Pyrinomonadaceae bacterium]|nr:hypothetical protein [Pyrinomonadaceae bacterium]